MGDSYVPFELVKNLKFENNSPVPGVQSVKQSTIVNSTK